jgi:Rap1a immunity proteins
MTRFAAQIIMLVLLLVTSNAARADEFTLGELKDDCERLETYWKLHPNNVPDNAGAAMCVGYMYAFASLSFFLPDKGTIGLDCSKGFGPTCWSVLHACLPKVVRFEQLLAVFLAYARNNPASWHEPATMHFSTAMSKAFPCEADTAR